MGQSAVNAAKFIYVCVCFAVSVGSYRFGFSRRDSLLLITGMAFTVASDFFLVLRDTDFTGLYLFCLVHAAYLFRASRSVKKPAAAVAVTLVCSVPAFIFFDTLLANALIYACLVAESVAANIINFKNSDRPKVNRALALAGVLLFCLCDINVLLFNLPRYAAVPRAIPATAYKFIWASYLSSQFVLAISGYSFGGRKSENRR